MKIILLKDVKGVGRRFEEKEISDGYAINFLIPKKLAVSIAGSGARAVKQLKKQEEKARQKKDQALNESLGRIAGTTLALTMKANEKGHLFAALTAEKLSQILKKEQGIELSSGHIMLKAPIKEIGTFAVPISVEKGKETTLTLEIKAA